MTKAFIGNLYGFFETGTEGVVWMLKRIGDGFKPYEEFVGIDCNDFLTVFDKQGKSIWSGVVDPDFKKNYTFYPGKNDLGQPQVLGRWVHWLQKDVEPETWASWFFEQYWAVLEK